MNCLKMKIGKFILHQRLQHTGNRTPTKQGRILPSGKSYPGFVDKTVKKIKFYPPCSEKVAKKKFRVDFRHWRPNIPILSIGIWGTHNGCPKSRLNQFLHRCTIRLFCSINNEKFLRQTAQSVSIERKKEELKV